MKQATITLATPISYYLEDKKFKDCPPYAKLYAKLYIHPTDEQHANIIITNNHWLHLEPITIHGEWPITLSKNYGAYYIPLKDIKSFGKSDYPLTITIDEKNTVITSKSGITKQIPTKTEVILHYKDIIPTAENPIEIMLNPAYLKTLLQTLAPTAKTETIKITYYDRRIKITSDTPGVEILLMPKV